MNSDVIKIYQVIYYSKAAITSKLNRYNFFLNGMILTKVVNYFRTKGSKISHVTIY